MATEKAITCVCEEGVAARPECAHCPNQPPSVEPFSEGDKSLMAFDLRIAAERYDADRQSMLEGQAEAEREGAKPRAENFRMLAEQFERQAARARAFARRLEEGGEL